MKRIGLVIVILAAVACAQQAGTQSEQAAPAPAQPHVAATNITPREQAPTYSDVYCAGAITNQAVPEHQYVVAGWDTPDQTRFNDRQYIYLAGGPFSPGAKYNIVRHVKDPNHFETFPGQRAAVSAAGEPYADMGRVVIVGNNGNIGIAKVELSCDGIMAGDLAIPYADRVIPPYVKGLPFDQFAPANGKMTGRIILAKDFDYLLGAGSKVYLNVGTDHGVKVGDYFRITRTYEQSAHDPADYLSYKATVADDTQKNPPTFPKSDLKDLPRRSIGQLIILSTEPKSSTGMISFALIPVQTGDDVEMIELPPPPPPTPPPAPNPPTISCLATPGTVQPGNTSTITCQGASPDNRPLTYNFTTDRGKLMPRDNTAVLDTTGIEPGAVNVTSTVTDDRNLSASAMNTINVEAPPPAPTASKLSDINFKPRSAYVDNRAKAILDDIALRLQREADATAVVKGFSGPKEPKSLAMRRADNVKRYLTASKGIDPKRITTTTGTEPEMKAEVWLVPAGAQPPQ